MKKIFSLLVVLIMGAVAFAGDFQVYKLDNGQNVIIQQVKNNPIVTIDTWIKTGSINETNKNNGVSHFLEHLFFKGTTNHAPGEFDKILETKGAITNAATSKDFTHYYITIPSEYFNLALEMHADMLSNPLIPGKELERERKVVIEEIAKDLNSPNTLCYDNLVDMLYTNHPYKRKVIGKKEIIETITRDEILSYYNDYYNPSNMITVIVGDVDPENAIKEVKENFKSEYKKPIKNVYPKEEILTQQKRKVAYFPTETGYMLIGFRGTKIDAKDSYALDVLATILGDGRSSVFYQDIKEKRQLANSISAMNAGFRDDGIFYISANFAPDKLQRLENAVFEDIKNVQKDGVTPEQLSLAKNIIERDTYYGRESISNIASEIGYTFVTTDDVKLYENYINEIKKVTLSDVKHVANKYLGVEKSAVSIVLPQNYQQVQQNNAEVQIAAIHPAKLVSENTSTQKYQLANNATVLVTPNEINDIIAISIYAKGGTLIEKKPGVAQITSSVILKGTKNYSSVELAKVLEDNGIKIQPAVKSDAFIINVLTTKNEYEKTLALLDEIINKAALDDYEIEKVKNNTIQAIKQSKDIPLNVAVDGYKNLIYEGSPYSISNETLEKAIPAITRSDIAEYYNQIFNPQNMVISINGNIDKEKTLNEFSKLLQVKQGEKFEYSNYANLIPYNKTVKTACKQIKDLKTDWILIGWQTSGTPNLKDYATLEIINTILGTGMDSRLFKNLRDKEGLAYQIGSEFAPNVLRGAFITFIGTNPENLECAKEKMLKEVFRFKTEFVSTKELEEAKDKLIGHYVIAQETNLDKAATIGWFEASGRGYEFNEQYKKLINSITESDIIEVANKYFNNNYVISIVKD